MKLITLLLSLLLSSSCKESGNKIKYPTLESEQKSAIEDSLYNEIDNRPESGELKF